MWLYIQPNDALFLRDGRSFDAGGNLYAGNLFPPYPPTCYGMIRTLLVHQVSSSVDYKDFFKNVPDEYQDLLGDKKNIGTLSVKGPFIGERGDEDVSLYVSCPADLFYEEDDEKNRNWYLLQPDKHLSLSAFSDVEIPFLKLRFEDEEKGTEFNPEDQMVGGYELEQYLLGNTDKSFLLTTEIKEPSWHNEPSTIIERADNTLTAQEHQLAYPEYTRMGNDKGMLLNLDDNHVPPFQGININRFGGEGRVCHVENLLVKSIFDENQMIEKIVSSGRFKALLATPGYFPKNGFYPDFMNCGENEVPEGYWIFGENKKRIRLMTMAAKRAVRIGGWNLANKVPKPMIKAVPAGSVFYFELVEHDKEKDRSWITHLVKNCMPGTLPGGDLNYCKQGFNTILIGGWDYV